MAVTEERQHVVSAIQKFYLEGKTSLSPSELKQISVDVANKKIIAKNLLLEKDIFDFFVSVIDKKLDLDGNSISDNKKLLDKIQNLWRADKREIKYSELHELNIHTRFDGLRIGNFKLSDTLFSKTYEISIVNISKSINDKIIDSAVDADKVLSVLHRFEFTQSMLKLSEVKLNKLIEDHFKLFFESVKSSDHRDAGLVDLNIGNGKFVIELKLSSKLKAAGEIQRALGQVEQYMNQFKSNFMVVIAGDRKDQDDKGIQQLYEKVKKNKGQFQFIFAN